MVDQGFFWQRHAEAEQWLLKLLDDFYGRNAGLQCLAEKFLQQASCRLYDWVDHLLLSDSATMRRQLSEFGFDLLPDIEQTVYSHPGALLPDVVLDGNCNGVEAGVILRVEFLGEFLQVNGFSAEIEGTPFSPYRRAFLGMEGDISLSVVERRVRKVFEPQSLTDAELHDHLAALELWQCRPRSSADEESAWNETQRLVGQLTARLGADRAAQVVCQGERIYWQSRNLIGRLQKSRQDTLGLGWANHDHHTFRSSRRNFVRLVSLFSELGFHCRERFYAGQEAGWGAQVMENPVAGLSLFLDVDLAPEEVATDFSRQELPEQDRLGTIGLWCALHGDSIFQAGMHHLAARCDFSRIDADIAEFGESFMAPFSDFPYLKQAFSVAERWQPDSARVAKLVDTGRINAEQGEKFLTEGAVGSHLENIQRDEGYKGFNKENVSAIIQETDPRK
jgi:hypothetical protein